MDGIRAEFRKLARDLKPGSNWRRRLVINALPVVGAGAAGAGVLFARKRFDPPDADFVGRRVTFACAPADDAKAAEVRRALETAGADGASLAALRRAARRLRGPLERDVVAAELEVSRGAARGALYAGLVEAWRRAGYFAEPEEKRQSSFKQGVDLVSQMDESYGRDLCCEVPLCLLREEKDGEPPRCLGVEDWAAAADALQRHGVVRLKELVSPEQILALRQRLSMQSSALDRHRLDARGLPPIRTFNPIRLQEEDPELDPAVTTHGRRHFYLRGRVFEDAVRHVQAGAMPLVWEHLLRTAQASGSEVRVPYVSEVQLVVADPCAMEQFWHVDNAAGGLTLFVPLTAVPTDLGPTLFLPGTHHLMAQGKAPGVCLSSLFSSDGVASGTMEAGDALLYDARTFHRCSTNARYERTRVALIFRYDFVRPPGVGAFGTIGVSWMGNMLAMLQGVYARLPAPAPEAVASKAAGAGAA